MSDMSKEKPELTKEQEAQVKEKFLHEIEEVSQVDVDYASKKGEEQLKKLDEKPPGTLREVWSDIKLMVSMLKDYTRGNYTDVPWKTIASITVAILYFASPIDLIPDFLPVIGYMDDFFVVVFALDFIRDDLEEYREWLENKA